MPPECLATSLLDAMLVADTCTHLSHTDEKLAWTRHMRMRSEFSLQPRLTQQGQSITKATRAKFAPAVESSEAL